MKISTYVQKQARVISECYDKDQSPASLKKYSDWFECCSQLIHEQSRQITTPKRQEIINFISERYHIHIALDDTEFTAGNVFIPLREYYSTKFAGTQAQMDLSDMPAVSFREKIGEILASIPGGLADFRNVSQAY